MVHDGWLIGVVLKTKNEQKKTTGMACGFFCVNLLNSRARLPRPSVQGTASGDVWGRHVSKIFHGRSVKHFYLLLCVATKVYLFWWHVCRFQLIEKLAWLKKYGYLSQ